MWTGVCGVVVDGDVVGDVVGASFDGLGRLTVSLSLWWWLCEC